MNYLKKRLAEFRYEFLEHTCKCLWYTITNVDDSILLWINNVAKKDEELEDNIFIHCLRNDGSDVHALKCGFVDVQSCGMCAKLQQKFGGKIIANYWFVPEKDAETIDVEEIKEFIKNC